MNDQIRLLSLFIGIIYTTLYNYKNGRVYTLIVYTSKNPKMSQSVEELQQFSRNPKFKLGRTIDYLSWI